MWVVMETELMERLHEVHCVRFDLDVFCRMGVCWPELHC